MLSDDPYLMQRPFVERRDTLVNSELYEAFKQMPKPAIHHSHVTAAASVPFLLKLTYYDIVYYSEEDNLFYVSKNGCKKPGYQECIKLRQYWTGAKAFDDYLREKILLKPTLPEPSNRWEQF
jgi:hypothetical protein